MLFKEFGTSGNGVNLATTPNGQAITVNNIHNAVPSLCTAFNENLLVGTRSTDTPFPNFTSWTSTLSRTADDLQIGERYEVRLIVSDQNENLDSAFFLEYPINEFVYNTSLNTTEGTVSGSGDNFVINACTSQLTMGFNDFTQDKLLINGLLV